MICAVFRPCLIYFSSVATSSPVSVDKFSRHFFLQQHLHLQIAPRGAGRPVNPDANLQTTRCVEIARIVHKAIQRKLQLHEVLNLNKKYFPSGKNGFVISYSTLRKRCRTLYPPYWEHIATNADDGRDDVVSPSVASALPGMLQEIASWQDAENAPEKAPRYGKSKKQPRAHRKAVADEEDDDEEEEVEAVEEPRKKMKTVSVSTTTTTTSTTSSMETTMTAFDMLVEIGRIFLEHDG